MNNPNLPSPAGGPDDDGQLPEVRLELTRQGVRQVLSLYADEQAGRTAQGGLQIGFADILRAMAARKGLVACCVLAGALLGGLVLWLTTPLYAVTAEVVLDQIDSADASLNSGRGGAAFVATQAEILQSRSVVEDALTHVTGGAPDAETLQQTLEMLQASPVSGTQVVALSYLGPDPSYGARLLTATVDAYRARLRADEQRNQAERLRAKEAESTALVDQMKHLGDQLAELRRAKFGGSSGADVVDAQNALIRSQALRLSEVRQQRIALENQLVAGSTAIATNDSVTRSLQDRLLQAEAALSRATQTLTPDHPTRVAAERDVALLKRQLATAMQAGPLALRAQIEAAKGLETELANVLATERNALATEEQSRREEQLVLDEITQTQTLIENRRRDLLDQRLLNRLAQSGDVGVTARLIAEPAQPLAPTWPNPLLVLAFGLIVGLAVGTCWAVVATRRRTDDWMAPDAHPRAFGT